MDSGNCMVAIKAPVVTELTTIIYPRLMLKQRLCDLIIVSFQWKQP